MRIIYEAPAKVILSGEHGVVYGKPALVFAINTILRCTATIQENTSTDKLTNYIIETVESYLQKKKIVYKKNNISLHFKSSIPPGRGLGSSAALSVAAAAACLHVLTETKPSRESVNNTAYLIEKKFHDNPSGVDVSASCFGGLIYYRKEFEFLKTISALNFKLPKHFEENLYLIDSGKPVESTKDMVMMLGKNHNKNPGDIERLLAKMEKITKKMTLSIVKEDLQLFSQCIAENEHILEDLNLVSISTIKMLKELEEFGVGKVTGAGGTKSGSGYILFLTNNKDHVESYLQKKNISYMKFNQGSEGVKLVT